MNEFSLPLCLNVPLLLCINSAADCPLTSGLESVLYKNTSASGRKAAWTPVTNHIFQCTLSIPLPQCPKHTHAPSSLFFFYFVQRKLPIIHAVLCGAVSKAASCRTLRIQRAPWLRPRRLILSCRTLQQWVMYRTKQSPKSCRNIVVLCTVLCI